MAAIRELTTKQLQQLESELLRERARLERSLEVRSVSDDATDGVVTRAPASEEGGVALALATRTNARYAAVLNALSRLTAGTYGICTACNSRIPFGRLLVMPEATACVTCGPRV